jgi:hypothetical protein
MHLTGIKTEFNKYASCFHVDCFTKCVVILIVTALPRGATGV